MAGADSRRSGQRGGQWEERTARRVNTKKGSIHYLKGSTFLKRVVFTKKGSLHLKGSSSLKKVVFT